MVKSSYSYPLILAYSLLKVFAIEWLLLVLTVRAHAQESRPGISIVCAGRAEQQASRITWAEPPSRIQADAAHFDVRYEEVPVEAQTALQEAISIWQTVLSSPVPIRLTLRWISLPGNALASTGTTRLYRNVRQALRPDAWYPVALAEKMEGHELNDPSEADIVVAINQDVRWYLGTDGRVPADRMDLVSVLLHELAHGLGFISSADVQGNQGSLGEQGHRLVYDELLENQQHQRLSVLPSPSSELAHNLAGAALYLASPAAASFNQGHLPRVHAPTVFSKHSSISHLDEATYPPGDPNSLMSPVFGLGEAIHVPGAILLGTLADLGWEMHRSSSSELAIFPNPSSGLVQVILPTPARYSEIRLLDALGREVRPMQVPVQESMLLTLSGMPNGVYLLVFSGPAHRSQQKFFLIR